MNSCLWNVKMTFSLNWLTILHKLKDNGKIYISQIKGHIDNKFLPFPSI